MTFATCRFLRMLCLVVTVPTLLAVLNGCAGKTEGVEAQAVYQSPGGVAVVDTFTTVGTIKAIDTRTRKVTLETPDGNSRTYKAAKNVDLSQFQVGQSLAVRISEETALEIRSGGTPVPGGAATLLATTGDEQGGAAFQGEAYETSAKITLINPRARKVTFQFPDGTTRTLKVHKDVDLSSLDVGQTVVVKYAVSMLVAVANS
jgi:Cu/Ag efflux protein CusF